MKPLTPENWVHAIGLLGVVGSLVFVGLQLRQSDKIAIADILESEADRGRELVTLMADNSEVWRKACLGEELSPSDEIIAGSIFRAYAIDNYYSWVRHKATGIGLGGDAQSLIDAFAANILRYPGFSKLAGSYGDWSNFGRHSDDPYTQEYEESLRDQILRMAQLEPKPDARLIWCGST